MTDTNEKPIRPQNRHLMPPITGANDPRTIAARKTHAKKRADKLRRLSHEESLRELKADSFDKAKFRIESGDIPDPIEVIQNMISEQILVVKALDPKATTYVKEKELLMKMNSQYADLVGAKQAATQSIELSVDRVDEKSPEQIQEELIKKTQALRVIN